MAKAYRLGNRMVLEIESVNAHLKACQIKRLTQSAHLQALKA